MGKPHKKTSQSSDKASRSKQQNDPDIFLSNGNDRNGKHRYNDDDDEDEIDTFYKEREDNLRTALSKTTTKKSSTNKKSVSWAFDNNSSDEGNGRDEVLAFDDDDSMGSDDDNDNEYQHIEGDDDDDEEMDEDLGGSWGSGKKEFYNEDANVDDEDAKLEEQEAVQIQKKYYDMLQTNDFGIDIFKQRPIPIPTDMNSDDQSLRRHIILPDNLLELSSNERLQLIRDQSPELEPLCNEFKNIFDDLKIYLLPFIQLVLDTSSLEEFQTYSGWQFVLCVLELYLTYCSYLSLYLTMKSTDANISKHPIRNDIEQYRKLCQLVNEDFQSMKSDLLKLCELLQEKKSKTNQSSLSIQKDLTSKPHLIINNGISLPNKTTNGTTVKPSLRERMMKRKQPLQTEAEIKVEKEDDKPQKRGITYEIEKNKGLTAKRKKEYRNPRVRNRNKYARALVKRTSRVPTARNEEEKYIGEPTGIRAGLKRGIRLKS